MQFDVIVIGGGSAGCVLAARLSEDAGRTVLLVEAGPDYADITALPADVRDASQPTFDHDWGYTADEELDRGMQVPRARIMGGCSATNACFAQRGAPQDYDGWVALGNPGWSFADVLDDFRRLESDTDFSDEWHGSDGPIPIRRHPRGELNAVQGIHRWCRRLRASAHRGSQPTGRRRSRRVASDSERRCAHEHRCHIPSRSTESTEPHHPA